MRLTIDHRTTYRFAEPRARLVQLLRMTPENTHDQTIANWDIAVDCDARMRRHRDGFGNCTTMLYCEGPIDTIEITVSGEVVTSHSNGELHGANEPLPPPVFLRTTPATVADVAIAAFALEAAEEGDPLDRLHRLNRAVGARFRIDRARPEPGLTAVDAFTAETATPRDLAHIFLAAARSLDIPARYVTGYSDLEGDHRPGPHGWADAWVEGIGWVSFDPTLGRSPEEHHIRIAVALDASGAAPVAGSRLGEGDETFDVEVTVLDED